MRRLGAAVAAVVAISLAGCQPDFEVHAGVTVTAQGTIVVVLSRCDYGPMKRAYIARSSGALADKDDERIWTYSGAPTFGPLVDTGVPADEYASAELYLRIGTKYPSSEEFSPGSLGVGQVQLGGRLRDLDSLLARRQGCSS